jgi:hypothetical protein
MLMSTVKENERGKKCRSLILQFNVHNCALASVENVFVIWQDICLNNEVRIWVVNYRLPLLSPLRVAADSAAIAAMPVCRESVSTHNSLFCGC